MRVGGRRFPAPDEGRAAVVGAGGGIGGALVEALLAEGIAVHAFARSIRPARPGLFPGHLDLTDETSIAAAFSGVAEAGTPPLRLVIVAAGLLHDASLTPEKSLRALDADRLARLFAVNAIGPALVVKHALPLLPRQGRSVVAVLSARVGSIADNRLGGWYGYRAAKAALNQFIRTAAVEARRTHPDAVLAALHPGTVATGLSRPFSGQVASERLFTPDVAAGHLLDVIAGLGASDSGGFFAWDGSAIPF